MAVTVDARTDGGKTSGATSLAWNHTVGAALTNGILIGHGTTGSAILKDITTFQWDAAGTPVALTQKNKVNDTSSNCYAQLWHLLAPASGTKQVKITPSASCEITGGSSSYSLVNQSTPWNASSTQSATGTAAGGVPQPSVTVTSAANEMAVVCVVENGGSTLVVGAGQTTIHLENIGASQHAGASSDEAGAATVVMDYTGVANGNPWAIIGGSLQFDAGGGGGGRTLFYRAGLDGCSTSGPKQFNPSLS